MRAKTLLMLGCLFSSYTFAWQLEVGGGPQRENFNGWVKYKGDKADLKKDLKIQDKTKYFVYLNLRHKAKLGFIPLPDIRIEYLRMNSSGTGKVSKSFTFGNLVITFNDRVHTTFKFHQLDTTFYYTPLKLKNVEGSWGIGIKVIDFKTTVKSLTTQQTESKSATIPLPYLYGRLGGEFLIFHLYGDFKGIAAGNKNYFYDWRAFGGVHYQFTKNFKISLDGGYRFQRYRVNDVDDVSADVRASGPFAAFNLTLTF